MNATTTATANLQDQVLSIFTTDIEKVQEQIERSEKEEIKLRKLLDEQQRKTEMLKGLRQDKIAAKSQGIAALQQVISAFKSADKVDPSGKMGDELLDTIINIRTAIADNDPLPELPPVKADEQPTPNPVEPESKSDPVIDVEAEPSESKPESISDRVEHVKKANASDKTPSQIATIQEVMDATKRLSYRQIQWLAQRQGIKSSGKASNIVSRIEDTIVAKNATYTLGDLAEAKLH